MSSISLAQFSQLALTRTRSVSLVHGGLLALDSSVTHYFLSVDIFWVVEDYLEDFITEEIVDQVALFDRR